MKRVLPQESPENGCDKTDRLSIRAEIEKKAAEICQKRFGPRLRALILTGSTARDEISISATRPCVELLSDAEFIGILAESCKLPSDGQSQELAAEITARLADEGIHLHVSAGFAHERFLRGMKPHIFGYELRTCGRVVAGDRRILSLIPSFSPEDIPREDAWRLLSNRMVEMAEALFAAKADPPSTELVYRTIKLYLDMATSVLIFKNGYAPSYRQRSDNVRALSASHAGELPPFDFAEFSAKVEACTSEKLGSFQIAAAIKDWQSVLRGCDYATKLWIWELQKMTGTADDSALRLCLRFAKQQELAGRIRGWLVVLRQQRWARSWRNWPRWLALMPVGSPRYCTYAAMGELFRSECLLGVESGSVTKGTSWKELYRLLPVRPASTRQDSEGPSSLGLAIGWNYHQFLEGTRG